jgi:CHASE3 domain sensor protein
MACISHNAVSMAKRSMEERVSAIEAQLAGKTLEEHFREQAELIDERFSEQDKKWDAKLEAKFESKLAPIRNDLAVVREAVKIILTRLT